MGLIELVFVVVAAAVSTAAFFAATRTGKRVDSAIERAPLRTAPLLIASCTIIVGAVIAVASGGLFVDAILRHVQSNTAIMVTNPLDPIVAYTYGSLLLASWLIIPGACAIGWLAISRARSSLNAAVFGVATWLGFAVGIALALLLLAPAIEAMVSASPIPSPMSVVSLVKSVVAAMFGLGVAGGCLGGVAVVATISLRRTIVATTALPFFALLVGALATPPDPSSQLGVATAIVLCWFAGLGVGALVGRVRRH